jgi:hypothetical protein
VEIHDTVLIAAAFCMYNRYVDGLDTWQPREEEPYRERGKKTAREGVRGYEPGIPEPGRPGGGGKELDSSSVGGIGERAASTFLINSAV